MHWYVPDTPVSLIAVVIPTARFFLYLSLSSFPILSFFLTCLSLITEDFSILSHTHILAFPTRAYRLMSNHTCQMYMRH